MDRRTDGQNCFFLTPKHPKSCRRTIYATCLRSYPHLIVSSCIYYVQINLNKIFLNQDPLLGHGPGNRIKIQFYIFSFFY